MGAWGVHAFDNDTACDWACMLQDSGKVALVQETLEETISVGANYLDSDVACMGLAAAEVVARMKGKADCHNAYTKRIDEWIAGEAFEVEQSVVQLAIAVIDRVRTPPSELLELWEGRADWLASLDNLRQRLSS
jgi:hypothetical protein